MVGDDTYAAHMRSQVVSLLGEIDELSRTTRAIVATGELRPALTGGA
jgi:hypothetical protein